MSIHFQYPQALWLLAGLPLVALLYFLYLRKRKKTLLAVGDPKLISGLSGGYSPVQNYIRFGLLMLAYVLGCLALANPRKPDSTMEEARKGIDIVVALDVSNSMKAKDISPDRLSRARHFISSLIDKLQDDRLGLVVFAGNAYAQMPLTFDREAARMYTATASPSIIPTQGTSIGDAFKKSELLFGEETGRFKSIVLITDGETHDEDALDDAKELARKGVMINTIGIGSPEGSTIMDTAGIPKKDQNGQIVISKLNEQILQEIAKITNGAYVHLQNSDEAVEAVMSQYNNIEKKALGDTSLYTYKLFYAWMALPMLLLLIGEVFIPDRKLKKA